MITTTNECVFIMGKSKLLATATSRRGGRAGRPRPAGFRCAVDLSQFLKDARIMIDAPTPAYPRWAIKQWRKNRPGMCAPGLPCRRRKTEPPQENGGDDG